MANLKALDGRNNLIYIQSSGAGSNVDPLVMTFTGSYQLGTLPAGANRFGLVTPYAAPGSAAATIAASASLSAAVDLGAGKLLSGLILPAAWTTANLTFQVSLDNSTFYNLYDNYGAEVIIRAAASRAIPAYLAYALFGGYRYFKVRSGTSGSPVTQASQRDLTLVTLAI